MDLAGYIVIGVLILIPFICLLVIVFNAGWLKGNEEFLKYLEAEREIAIRNHSWAAVNSAQAEFNSDFFEELWATNDSRLTIG